MVYNIILFYLFIYIYYIFYIFIYILFIINIIQNCAYTIFPKCFSCFFLQTYRKNPFKVPTINPFENGTACNNLSTPPNTIFVYINEKKTSSSLRI